MTQLVRGSGRDLQVAARAGSPSTGGGSGSAPTSFPTGPCTSADFAAATGAAFVEMVATSTDACLDQLWTFDGDVQTAISPGNVMLIAATIEVEALDLLITTRSLSITSFTRRA